MNLYFAGAEDFDNISLAGAPITTTAGTFRSGFGRCALQLGGSTTQLWQNAVQYVGTPSTFWWSGRFQMTVGASVTINTFMIRFLDGAALARLQIKCSVGGAFGTNVMIVQKVNTAGTATTLANTLPPWSLGMTGNPDKIDINWVNSASGSIVIYYNGVPVYNYSGDTTTETTTIASHVFASISGNTTNWSEIIVSDTDTRSLNLQTLQPVANGNTHNFDTGSPAASNVNEVTLSDATLDGSTTANQIDEYTIPALATGTFSIVAVGVVARAQKGASGPTKLDLVVRVGSTDYLSSDQSLTVFWATYQNWWLTDPSTSAAWAALPTNIGIKSIA